MEKLGAKRKNLTHIVLLSKETVHIILKNSCQANNWKALVLAKDKASITRKKNSKTFTYVSYPIRTLR